MTMYQVNNLEDIIGMDPKPDPALCYIQEVHFTYEDTYILKVNG